jgi:hypothetical protein
MRGRARARILEALAACSVIVRAPNLRRAELAFGAAWTGEWAATVALGVVAFRDGGAAAVGLVGLARMLPAALIAPFAATSADRMRRELVLVLVGVVRVGMLGVAAAAAFADGPRAVIYGALVVATVAQTLFRPAHSALLPSLCTTPAELMSANVVRGWLDSISVLVGPLGAAVLLALSGPGAVFGAAAAASALSAALCTRMRYETPPRVTESVPGGTLRETLDGLRSIVADRGLLLLTALATLQTFTRGALTVLSVVVAFKLLGIGASGVGVLNAAVGAGAVLGSFSAALVVRTGQLGRWLGIGVALWGLPLAAIGAFPHEWAAIVMLAVIGIGNAFVDVGAFTIPARLVDDAVLARAFAAFEAILTLGVAAGAIATPGLITALGTRSALVVVGAITPVAVLAGWHGLHALDQRLRVRDADIALLQGVAMLRPLPATTIEQLAAVLERTTIAAGTYVFEQGDVGDDFYVIEGGQADVVGDGRTIRTLGPGEGFGEIALLRRCRRTTSVLASSDLTLGRINQRRFVMAVGGYSPSTNIADDVVAGHLTRFSPDAAAPSSS